MRKSIPIAVLATVMLANSGAIASLRAQTKNPSESAPAAQAVVELPTFIVNAERDVGYQASNSITATKFATELKNVPLTVNVFTEDFIRDIGAIEVGDVLKYANGMNASQNSGGDDIQYVSRGFPQNANSVQLRNGIRKSGLLDVASQQRVEFMKGPTSVLNGIMSPGGTANIITKRPQPKFGASVDQTFGSFGLNRTVMDLTGPAFTNAGNKKYGSLYYRVIGARTRDGDFRDFSDRDKNYLYAMFVYRLGEGTQFTYDFEDVAQKGHPTASVGWYSSSSVVPSTRFAPPLPVDFNRTAYGHYDNFKARNHVLNLEQKLGDHFNLRIANQYQTRIRDQFRPNGSIGTTNNNLLSRTSDYVIQKNFNSRWYVYLFGEFELGKGSRLKSILGWEDQVDLYTRYTEVFRPGVAAFPGAPAAPVSWLLNDPSTWNRNDAVRTDLRPNNGFRQNILDKTYFIVNQLSLFKEKLFLTASIRRDVASSDQISVFNSLTVAPNELTYDSPQYGLLWRVRPSLGFYASYGESFIYASGVRLNPDRTESPFDPTTGKGLEFGVKTDFFYGRVSANLAFFDIEQSNLQRTISVPDPLNPGFTFNATVQNGVEKSRGVEFNVNASITKGFQIVAGASYLDGYVKSNVQVPALVGTRLANAPGHKYTAHVRYNLPKTVLSGAYVTLGYIWQGSANGNSGLLPVTYLPVWKTWSAGAGYSFKAWQRRFSLRVSADNLANSYYWPTIGAPGNPRSFKSSLRMEF